MSFPAFWREKPLAQFEQDLLESLIAAHDLSARRNNISTVTAINTYAGSHSIANAIAAACLTIGGPHAPLTPTIDVITGFMAGDKLPDHVAGWGSDFVKDGEDPDWQYVKLNLKTFHKRIFDSIEGITGVLHDRGIMIYPNPACYTAAVCIALGVRKELAPSIFILCRIPAWVNVVAQNIK